MNRPHSCQTLPDKKKKKKEKKITLARFSSESVIFFFFLALFTFFLCLSLSFLFRPSLPLTLFPSFRFLFKVTPVYFRVMFFCPFELCFGLCKGAVLLFQRDGVFSSTVTDRSRCVVRECVVRQRCGVMVQGDGVAECKRRKCNDE